MINIRCPDCGEHERPEVIEVLPGRAYKIKCRRCGKEFIVSAAPDSDERDHLDP